MKERNLSSNVPMLLRQAAALLRVAPAVENNDDLPVACDGAKAALNTAKTINDDGGEA